MTLPPPDPVYVLSGDMGPIHCLEFWLSQNLEILLAGAQSGIIHVWDIKKSREIFKFNSSNEPCLSIVKTGDDMLAAQRKGGLIEFWSVKNQEWVHYKNFGTNYIGFCKNQSLTNDSLVIPLRDATVGILSIKNMQIEIQLNAKVIPNVDKIGDVMALKVLDKDVNKVLAAYDGGQLLLWDIRSNNVLSSLKVNDPPMALDFSCAKDHGVLGNPEQDLEIFSLCENELSLTKRAQLKNAGISTITIRPDSKILATGGWDHQIRLFSFKSLKPLAILNIHKSCIHDIAFSLKHVQTYNVDFLMAAASKDGRISLWDIYN